MTVAAVEVEWRRILKFVSAAFAGLLAIPGLVKAQAQKITSDWLQLTPSDGKGPISGSRASVTTDDDSTTVSIERRSRFRSRADSVSGERALEASKKDPHLHIVVSIDDRKLWVVAGADTVMQAPVATGSGNTLIFGQKSWSFDTPRGIRTIQNKDADPHWIPPEWHYAETATEYGLRLEKLQLNKPYELSDGRKIMFQDGEAGVFHPDSGFMYLPLEEEIVFDNTLFIPPVGSKNRAVQGELGKYKLDTGGGVLLHGTPHQTSVGKAVTHGCMRLRDEDIEWLYQFVPVGTKVYIY